MGSHSTEKQLDCDFLEQDLQKVGISGGYHLYTLRNYVVIKDTFWLMRHIWGGHKKSEADEMV